MKAMCRYKDLFEGNLPLVGETGSSWLSGLLCLSTTQKHETQLVQPRVSIARRSNHVPFAILLTSPLFPF